MLFRLPLVTSVTYLFFITKHSGVPLPVLHSIGDYILLNITTEI